MGNLVRRAGPCNIEISRDVRNLSPRSLCKDKDVCGNNRICCTPLNTFTSSFSQRLTDLEYLELSPNNSICCLLHPSNPRLLCRHGCFCQLVELLLFKPPFLLTLVYDFGPSTPRRPRLPITCILETALSARSLSPGRLGPLRRSFALCELSTWLQRREL